MGGRSSYVDADLAFRTSTHVRLVVGSRRIVIRQSGDTRLWWHPITGGLRIQ